MSLPRLPCRAACRRAARVGDHGGTRSSPPYPACDTRARRRHFSPYPRPRQRPGRPRSRGRHHRRQLDRRRARQSGACRDRAAYEARCPSRRDPPRAAADRSAGVGPFRAHDPAAETRRAARPRRQGRRLHPSAQTRRPHDSRLHAARRIAALQARLRERPDLWPDRARADEQHRPVPVRKRVRPRHLSTHDRHSQRPGALRVQRRHRR